MAHNDPRSLRVEEPARVPWDAVLLGWGPVIPFPVAAIWLWLGGPAGLEPAMQVWGASVVLFLSGVRRGLSFRMPGGWTWTQMTMFAILFRAGLAAVLLPSGAAILLLAAIFASLALIDPVSAERQEVPLWFRPLMPLQMAGAAIRLSGIWWQSWPAKRRPRQFRQRARRCLRRSRLSGSARR